MSDFLTRMVQRQRGEISTVQPKVVSRFATMDEESVMPMLEQATASLSPATQPQDAPTETHRSVVVSQRNAEESQVTSMRPDISPVRSEQPTMSAGLNEASGESSKPTIPPVIERVLSAPPMTFQEGIASECVVKPRISSSETSVRPKQSEESERLFYRRRPDLPARLVAAPPAAQGSVHAPQSLVTRGTLDGPTSRESNGTEQPVTVTIGRIEVTTLSSEVAPKRKGTVRQPAMSLQDYLSGRQRRSR